MGRDVPGQTGTGRPVVPLSRDKKVSLSRRPFVPGQKSFACPAVPLSRDKGRSKCPGTNSSVPGRPGTKWILRNSEKKNRYPVLEHPFPVLERLFPVLECPFPVFLFFWEAYFVPGRDGTEEFVPGHLLLPLSRDKGTPGQEFFFVPGQRDNGTSRPGLSRDVPRDVPSLGNTNID